MGIQGFKIIARQRARLVGELQGLEKNILREQGRIQEILTKIAAFDEVLRAQNVDVDPDLYAPPVKTTPRLHYFAHGELIGTCLDLLRTQQRPLSPAQLLNAIIEMKKPQWRSPDDPQKLRRTIKGQLNAYMKRGLVVRIGNGEPGNNADGMWALPEYANVPWEAGAVVLAS